MAVNIRQINSISRALGASTVRHDRTASSASAFTGNKRIIVSESPGSTRGRTGEAEQLPHGERHVQSSRDSSSPHLQARRSSTFARRDRGTETGSAARRGVGQLRRAVVARGGVEDDARWTMVKVDDVVKEARKAEMHRSAGGAGTCSAWLAPGRSDSEGGYPCARAPKGILTQGNNGCRTEVITC